MLVSYTIVYLNFYSEGLQILLKQKDLRTLNGESNHLLAERTVIFIK